MNKKILFVYGTLKRGEFNDVSRYDPSPVFLGEGWVRGRLYDLGHCPTMEFDPEGDPVWGEVFELDAELFEVLDRYEALCGDYVRETMTVHVAEGALQATVYVSGPNQAAPRTCLPEGRWPLADARHHMISICYALEFGPDLPGLAEKAGLSIEALINMHLAQRFTVAPEGFLPGFVSLDGMPPALRFARRGVPRPRVVAGSVGVFENLCGIYPKDGPGSWHLIGRVLDMAPDVRAMRTGDTVSFRRVSLDKA